MTERLEGESIHASLTVLPGGTMGVFQVWHARNGEDAEIWAIDLASGERSVLIAGKSPEYASTGHLLFGTPDRLLMAAPLDPVTAELAGPAISVVEGLAVGPAFGVMEYGTSQSGTLIYAAGAGGGRGSSDQTLALVGRDGAVEPLTVPPAPYLSPRLSPDGEKLVVQTAEDDGGVLWVYDLAGDAQIQQLTFEGDNQRPIWTPDGQRITFSSDREGTMSLYSMPADGSGVAERLTTADEGTFHWPGSWAPDGQTLLFNVDGDRQNDWDIWTLSANTLETESLYDTPNTVYIGAELSPDGQWLAYSSVPTASGRDIYVEPFPRVWISLGATRTG